MLRAELETQKMRAAELERAYQNDLRIEKGKEELLEKELARLKQENKWQTMVDELQAELERTRGAVAGDVLQEQMDKHERDKQLLIEKQIAVMEENFVLRQKLEDFDVMREKLFFALALALKLNESSKGVLLNNLDATQIWEDEARKMHFSQWNALLEQKKK